MIKRLLILLFFLSLAPLLWAQVVTPSLDPAVGVDLAVASSWRFGSTIGVEKINIQKQTVKDQVSPVDYSTTGVIAYQPTHASLEIIGLANEVEPYWDPSSDTYTQIQNKSTKINIAVRGINRFSIGIGFNNGQSVSKTEEVSWKSFSGSFGVRLLNAIYLASGIERVTEVPAVNVTRKWDRTFAGLALMFGYPDNYMLRMEASSNSSPAAKALVLDSSGHPKTVVTKGAFEVLMKGYLLTLQAKAKVITPLIAGQDDRKTNLSTFGFGLRANSFSWVLYGSQGQEIIGSSQRDIKFYKVTLGFSFI